MTYENYSIRSLEECVAASGLVAFLQAENERPIRNSSDQCDAGKLDRPANNQAENITLSQDNFNRLGEEAKEILEFLAVEHVSAIAKDNKNYVVIDLRKEKQFGTKSVTLGNGKKGTLTSPTEDSRLFQLPDAKVEVLADARILAEVVRKEQGEIELRNIKGIACAAGTDLGKLSATITSITIRQAEGKCEVVIRADAGFTIHEQVLPLEPEYADKLISLFENLAKLQTANDPSIKTQNSVDDLLNVKEEPSLLKIAAQIGIASALAITLKKMFDLSKGKMPEVKSEKEVKEVRVGGKPAKPGTETGVATDGSISKEAGDSVAKIKCDAAGRLMLCDVAENKPVFIRRADGTIDQIKHNKSAIELKPGEAFSLGYPEFTEVVERKTAPLVVKVGDNSRIHSGIRGKTISFESGDSLEVGRGAGDRLLPAKSATARIEFLNLDMSRGHAIVACDEGGLFVMDGVPAKNQIENMPSRKGTWVNDKQLELGEKVYLKEGDKVNFGYDASITDIPAMTVEKNVPQERDNTLSSEVKNVNVMRVLQGSDGKGEVFKLVPNQVINIGKTGDLNVGGAYLADKHAELFINRKGEAFIKITASDNGKNEACIETKSSIVKVTPADGWIPVHPSDKISVGGSKPFVVGQKIAPGTTVFVGNQFQDRYFLTPEKGDLIYLGRGQNPSSGTAISFTSLEVGREHALIGVDKDGRLYIEEIGKKGEGTKNGTFLNNKQIRPGVRYYLNENDKIRLGSLEAGAFIMVEEITPLGHPPGTDAPEKAKTKFLFPIGADLTNRPIDPKIPTKLEGTRIVAEVDGKKIRIMPGLGHDLPREYVSLTQRELANLGKPGSNFERVELSIGGRKESYYKDLATNRFYLLIDQSGTAPRLMRDHEIFVEPGETQAKPGNDKDRVTPGNEPVSSDTNLKSNELEAVRKILETHKLPADKVTEELFLNLIDLEIAKSNDAEERKLLEILKGKLSKPGRDLTKNVAEYIGPTAPAPPTAAADGNVPPTPLPDPLP
ncbi:MAG: FHA domain-containing protein, partial [Cyanobacteria bacterium]|nr:FHA domain-containing protein [Cyanobacteriota bacterium]